MVRKLINIYRSYKQKNIQNEYISQQAKNRKEFFENGQIPWSPYYVTFKNEKISEAINDKNNLQIFRNKQIPQEFGYRLDERIVEYSWIFSQLPKGKLKLLDAGSTFNFDFIVNHQLIEEKELRILTYAPETNNFNNKRISYVYDDLREIPFKDNYFDFIVSQSTLEHIDMDNSIYGYNLDHNTQSEIKSYEYLKAIEELVRVLKDGGQLLLTFPYGKFENHGFFQQFDKEMVERLVLIFENIGVFYCEFFKYKKSGWVTSTQNDCNNEESYNPHTGKGKKDDGAAHSRAICCIKFVKNIEQS
jgi:SAM-dependent methyltransferase